MVEKIRVLVADDHAIVREGLRGLIQSEPNLELVGEASNGQAAVRLAHDLQPDIILMDLMMPVTNGIEATSEIKSQNPQARILVLTSFSDDDQVFQALKAGAQGYLLKDSAPIELLRAIRRVYRGETILHPQIALKLIQEIRQPPDLPPLEEPLTTREIEVLKLIATGATNQEIADQLVITERTVRNHVSNILDKLHLANRTQAALYALREGLAKLED